MSAQRPLVATYVVLLLAAPVSAGTGDVQCLPAKKMLMRAKGDRARQRSVAVLSTDRAIDLGGGNGSVDDPTIHGGSLRIFSEAGGFDDTYDLPAKRWDYVKRAGEGRGYKFRRTNPIKAIRIQPRKRIRIAAKGAGLGHSVASNPAPVTVRLTIGEKRYCFVFGGTVTHKPDKKFFAVDAVAPESCPLPGEPTTTTTTLTPTS